jgi:putative glutamine amidotransferase
MMRKKPFIGVTFDAQEGGSYSQFPWYVLRENYCSSVVNAGGIPIPLIHDLDLIEPYLTFLDGLVITGGGHDIDPTLYGVQERHPTVTLKPRRTSFEMEIAKCALKKNLPLLGICGGQQLINVALGGTLIQHIPDEVPHCLDHGQPHSRDNSSHPIRVLQGTRLYQILETEAFAVNSIHHQAVKDPAPGVVINALAPDGVIEGLEAPAYRFCLGLQWHPEFIVTPHDGAIFKAFVEASGG